MRHRTRLMFFAVGLGVVGAWVGGTQAQQPPAPSATQAVASTPSPLPLANPYRLDESFKPEIPKGLTSLGSVTAVKVGVDNNLYVFHRCVLDSCAGHEDIDPILVYNQQAKLLRQMGAGQFSWPHGLFVMPDLTFWTADASGPPAENAPRRGQQVLHHDKTGKVIMAIGTVGVEGNDHNTFSRPADVAVGKNGDVFVADGHGRNGRLVKFNNKGEYVTECGGPGTAPGQIAVPHGLVIDSQGRVIVADRNNSRLNIYDQDCKFLMEWRQFGRPTGIAIDRNDMIYVVDTQPTTGRVGFENGIYVGSARDGKVTGFIPKVRPRSVWEVEASAGGRGRATAAPGTPAVPGSGGRAEAAPVTGAVADATNMESIGVAPDGSAVYGGEVGLMTVIKFVRK